MKPFLEELSRVADTNVHVYPNAGLPNPLSDTGYDETPKHTGTAVGGFAKDGLVNMVGGGPTSSSEASSSSSTSASGYRYTKPGAYFFLRKLTNKIYCTYLIIILLIRYLSKNECVQMKF